MTGSCSKTSDSFEIRKYAAGFSKNRYRSECPSNPDVLDGFFRGLPQDSEDTSVGLAAEATLQPCRHLEPARGTTPGTDGLSAELYNLGRYRWRPAGGGLRKPAANAERPNGHKDNGSLLCTDHQILPEVLALRLMEVMCLSSSRSTQTGLISMSQEKALDRVDQYLWSTSAAFRFSFSGMLYSTAVEPPIVGPIASKMNKFTFSSMSVSLKLSVYADDVIVLTNSQEDIGVFTNTLHELGFISSAEGVREKSETLMAGGGVGWVAVSHHPVVFSGRREDYGTLGPSWGRKMT